MAMTETVPVQVEGGNSLLRSLGSAIGWRTGTRFSDAGWQADLSEVRQVLGQYGTSLTRFFSAR